MDNEPSQSQWDQMTTRMDAFDAFRTETLSKFDEGKGVMDGLRKDLNANTEETKRVKEDTGELLDILKSWKGAFKVFNWVGKLAGPLAGIIALGTAVWGAVMAFKGGGGMPK